MVSVQLTLERFEDRAAVRCATCGLEERFGPGMALPSSGGALQVHDGRVVSRTCGACWAATPKDFSREPYHPDPYQVAMERYCARRQHETWMAEVWREHPTWFLPAARSRL